MTAHYAGDANHLASDGSAVAIIIGKATTATVVTINGGPFTYTSLAQTPATVSVSGAGGLSLTPTAVYANNVNAGMATASYSYAGDANHFGSNNGQTFSIGKATATFTVTPYTVTYDGGPHTAAVSTITGVNGETGATVGTITLNTTHTAAGAYSTDSWSFTGAANYNNIAATTIIDAIGQASALITVTPYSVVYNAVAHTATGTATGVASVNLSNDLTLSGTTHTYAGTYNGDAWSFHDATGNYKDASGTVHNSISLDATTTVLVASGLATVHFGQSVTFTATVTANARGGGTPTGSVTFVDTTTGVMLGTGTLTNGQAVLTTSLLPVGSQTITATYGGSSNYLSSTGASNTSMNVMAADYLLNATAAGSLSLSGNAHLDLPGTIYVNSSSAGAVSATGNANLLATAIDVVGGIQTSGNAHLRTTQVTGAASAVDPLAGLAAPSISGSVQSAVTVSGNSSLTLNPGIYSGITVSGNGKLTLNPGTYVLAGAGFNVSGNGIVHGTGVLLYNAGSNYPATGGSYGPVSITGNGQVNLSAAVMGVDAGIVLFQARDNTSAVSLSGNAILNLHGGVVYTPSAIVNQSGNAQVNGFDLIAAELQVSGNGIDTTTGLVGPATGTHNQASSVTTLLDSSTAALAQSGTNFSINWGDGHNQSVGTSNETAVSHTFASSGTYAVELLATDANGVVIVLGMLTLTIS